MLLQLLPSCLQLSFLWFHFLPLLPSLPTTSLHTFLSLPTTTSCFPAYYPLLSPLCFLLLLYLSPTTCLPPSLLPPTIATLTSHAWVGFPPTHLGSFWVGTCFLFLSTTPTTSRLQLPYHAPTYHPLPPSLLPSLSLAGFWLGCLAWHGHGR